MNFDVNLSMADEQEVTEIPTTLARWYAAHSSIRRLWAVEDRDAFIVFVALEPTSDGDDALPVWLAKKRDWMNDLKSLANREVHLQLIVSGVFDKSYVNTGTVMIAAARAHPCAPRHSHDPCAADLELA